MLLDKQHVYAGAPLTNYFHLDGTGVVRVFVRASIFANGFD